MTLSGTESDYPVRRYGLLMRWHWVTLLFCLLNLAFFALYNPYVPQGGQLIENANFTRGLEGWKLEGKRQIVETAHGGVSIDHGATAETTMLSQCRAANTLPDTLLLSADVGTREVVRGKIPWHDARLVLVGYDAQGRADYHVKSVLVALDGNRVRQTYSAIFHKPPSSTRLCFRISLYAAAGYLEVGHLSLHGVSKRPLHAYGRGLLLAGWIVLGLWLAQALFEYYRLRPRGAVLLPLLVLVLLLGGILMPQEIRFAIEQHLALLLSSIGLDIEVTEIYQRHDTWALWPERWDISKLAHLTGFTLLAWVVLRDRGVRVVDVLSALVLLAVATELMQFFVPGRTPRLSDVIVDSVGITLGCGLGLAYRLRHRHHRSG